MKIQHLLAVLCLAVFWFQLDGPAALMTYAQSSVSQLPLSIGKPIEKELKAGETHRYTLELSAGEFVHLVAEQKAIDVVVTVIDPVGNQVVKVNYFDRMYGPEPVFWIAAQSGIYEVRITPLKPDPEIGKYTIELQTCRTAIDQDQACIMAVELISEGDLLLTQSSENSQQQALDRYLKAASIFQTQGLTWMEATARVQAGYSYSQLGNTDRFLELYQQARALYQRIGDEQGIARVNFLVGTSYAKLRRFPEGISHLKQAIEFGQKTNQPAFEASAQVELAALYEDLGDIKEAFERFNQAIYLAHLAGDPKTEATALARLSRHYKIFGDTPKALAYAQQALALFQSIGDKAGEDMILAVLGWVYKMDKQPEKALEYYLKQTTFPGKDLFNKGEYLTFIGQCYLEMNKYDQALGSFTHSLEILQITNSPNLISIAVSNIATTYFRMKNYEKALEYYFQVLELTKEPTEARYGSLIRIAQIYHLLGKLSKAREYYQLALENRQQRNQTFWFYDCYNYFATFEYQVGNLSEAKKLLNSAIEAVEQVRSGYVTPQNRALFFTYSQTTYDLLIDVLFSLHEKDPSTGHIAEAFAVSEKRRARSLSEQLVETKLPPAANVPPELLARRDTLAKTLTDKTEAFLPLRENDPERAKAQQELDILSTELELVEAEIRKANPAFANLTAPQPLSASQVQAQVLDADTQLVSYQLGAERSFAWVISKDRVDGVVLPKRSEIETAVRTFVNHLTGKHEGGSTPDSINATGKVVSDLILKPLASQLTAKRLIIIPDGALFYLPFGALPAQLKANQRQTRSTPAYLIEQFELTFEPSASTLVALRETFQNRTRPNQTAFVLANPIFSTTDDRFKGAAKKQTASKTEAAQLRTYQEERLLSAVGDTWLPIPGTSEQAKVIRQLAGPNRCRVVEGFAASKKFLTQTDLSPFRIVHFATHGRFDSTRPEFSGLVLSLVDEQAQKQPGYFLSQEIYNLKLNADLVVLSACESGLGKELKGEGVIGLTRAFMYAGSPRVIASLWSVSDSSTAELMKRFYHHLLSKTNPLPPAQALQKAQIEMLTDKNPKWRLPFHWAAFQLQGEYR